MIRALAALALALPLAVACASAPPPLPGGKVIYGWGHGPLGKTAPGVKTYDAKFEGDAFSFTLPDFLMVRGVRRGEAMRVTIELPDRTRAAADMHPI